MVAQRAGTPHSPILSGIVPPLADSYFQRPETGLARSGGRYPGDAVVLTDGAGSDGAGTEGAGGGTGKTQLAAASAHALWSVRAVEVLVWILGVDHPMTRTIRENLDNASQT